MKIAWLVWDNEWDREPQIKFTEPEVYGWYYKVQQIVYMEIVAHNDI